MTATAILMMGPTAVGKTELAMQLCQQTPCEIISVDSALVYRNMNIGTAKPSPQELTQYPHHLINIRNPDEPYSVAEFCTDALDLMKQICQRGNTPLLVGGTMMYFNALQYGLTDLPSANEAIRSDIEAQAKVEGWQKIHQQLAAIDPVSAKRIHPNDRQRLQRALEVYKITGQSLTRLQHNNQKQGLPYKTIKIVLATNDRQWLHERIAKRFNQMIEMGFEQEVRSLTENYQLTPDFPSMRAVGYRQMWQYIKGELSLAEMTEKGITATRQLAKRQFTWLRSEKEAHWFDALDRDKFKLINELVQRNQDDRHKKI
ncbi:MAG: tRNA (adenosine(37)-N6)-dimethylallyltransferase MiaA [Methylococcales bacterium]|nr:tRNA (adenosine(37)-N6)-dimethylallyltransferase MiaA [Methylococcales bacterium]MBT7408186.1 tRNA (adenosine(37)-N6)-dimethylallyltransferase MiaA [Methylococcales bacterium]